jgi:hypothetical protein
MVIGHSFAWGHLPKAGGDATLRLFGLFPELVLFADEAESNAKHTPFRERADRIEGKLKVLNLRRLPEWALSYSLHKASRGLYPAYRPRAMESPEQIAGSALPDRHLASFMDSAIDRWLRVEALPEDFLAFVSELTDVHADRRRAATQSGRVNFAEYDRDVTHWFTPEQLKRLYESNPLWTETERRVYGNLMLDQIEVA